MLIREKLFYVNLLLTSLRNFTKNFLFCKKKKNKKDKNKNLSLY